MGGIVNFNPFTGKGEIINSGGGGLALGSISAGTTMASLGTVVFSNSNGVSFGVNGQTVTASHNAITTETPFGISAGSQSNSTGTMVFSNSNGITFGMSNSSIVTASHNGLTSQSNQALSGSNGSFAFQTATFGNLNNMSFYTSGGSMVGSYALNVSASTTSNNLSAITFGNANGITFGLDASTITASHNGLTSQSNQAISGSNGSFTFQTATFGNLNNITHYTSNGSLVASYAFNVSASTTSNNLSALTFANSNGITFGLDASTITASHNGLTSQSNQALSGSNGSFTFQTATFGNLNGLSFYSSNGSMVGSYSTNEGTLQFFENPIAGRIDAINITNAVGSMFVNALIVPQNVTATVVDYYGSIVLTSSATANTTYAGTFTYSVAIYTKNASTLSLASSSAQTFSYSYTSNVSNTVLSGMRRFTIPMNVNMTPGNYWYAYNHSASFDSGSITISMVGMANQATNFSGAWGSATNSTNHLVPFQGLYSVTTGGFPNSIVGTDLYQGAPGGGGLTQRAGQPIYIAFRNIDM